MENPQNECEKVWREYEQLFSELIIEIEEEEKNKER